MILHAMAGATCKNWGILCRWLIGCALLFSVMSGPVRAQPNDFPRTVTDLTGQSVMIPARPTLIGVVGSETLLVRLVDPTELREIALFADHIAWDELDLLVIADVYAAANPGLVEAAARAMVPVFHTTALTSLDQWRTALRQLGAATGRDQRAADLMLQLDRRLAWAAAVSGDPVRVLVLTPEGYTFGAETLISDVIVAAGGTNVAAEAGFADYRQIADTTIQVLAPDVILLAPSGDRAAFLQAAVYANVPAVQTGRVYSLPFSPTAPPDPGRAVVLLAWVLHPHSILNLFLAR